jgi:hypothetical protein
LSFSYPPVLRRSLQESEHFAAKLAKPVCDLFYFSGRHLNCFSSGSIRWLKPSPQFHEQNRTFDGVTYPASMNIIMTGIGQSVDFVDYLRRFCGIGRLFELKPIPDKLDFSGKLMRQGSLSSSKRGNAWVCAMTDDEEAIRDLIARQFGSLNWRPGASGNWSAFTSDFLVEGDNWQLRYPVGPDAAPFLKWRASLTDEEVVNNSGASDAEYKARVKQVFRLDLKL